MGDAESNKTSDEIINELFCSLNVPLSPKVYEPEEIDTKDEVSANFVDSDNCAERESDSESSESEEDSKDVDQVVQENSPTEKAENRKAPKKKKEKKKKKKKRKRKEDGGRHKHKKKKKESSNASENDKISAGILQDIRIRNQALIEKILGQEEVEKTNTLDVEEKMKSKSRSRSPCIIESPSKSSELDDGNKCKLKSDTDSKDEPQGNHCESEPVTNSSSPSRLLPHPVNACRSRSGSRVQETLSKSRSRSPSKYTRTSRSSSKTKSSQKKSRTRSPVTLDGCERSTKSQSRSATPKHSTVQRSSELPVHSRSSSPKTLAKQRSKSRSRRKSRSRSRRKSKSGSRGKSRSRSRRKSRSRSRRSGSKFQRISRSRSRRRSRSRSRRSKSRRSGSKSRRRSSSRSQRRSRSLRRSSSKTQRALHSKEISESSEKGKERSDRTGELKGLGAPNVDLTSIPTPGVKLGSKIALDSIPLPIPPLAVPDPRSIPLPQPALNPDGSLMEEVKGVNGEGLDLKAIPVPAPSNDPHSKEQDTNKTREGSKSKQEEGSDKGKAKMIVIKSLKDSLVFLQAQEEAERRAKELADIQGNETEEMEEEDEANRGEEEDRDIQQQGKDSVEEDGEKVVDGDIGVMEKEELKERKEVAEKKEETGSEKEKKRENAESKIDEKVVCADAKKNGEHDDNDTLNGMEEGEIASDDEEAEVKSHSKSHSRKKSKKDKDKSKEKKKSRKTKEKGKEDKKRGRDRSRSPEREKTRSRSKEKHRSRRHSSSRVKDRRHRRYSRSHSRDRSRLHRRSYSRSRSRSRSRSGRRQDPMADLRDKMTRKRLLEIARRNAVYLMQNGCLPPSVEQEQLVKIKAGGKSVDELTDFCKQLVASGNYSDVDLSDPSLSSGDDNDNTDKPFSNTRHPFSVRDTKPILMNIRNAPMLPTKTNAERLAGQAKLREQFPVSSGSQHRTKGELISSDGKHQSESDWVPVPPKEKKEEEDKVFPKSEPLAVDISQIVSTRLSAMRKLQDNPHDSEAIKTLHNAQKEMQNWALSKQEPGQFTGTTGAKVLSQEELSAGHQAWARKMPSCQLRRESTKGVEHSCRHHVPPQHKRIPKHLDTTRDQEQFKEAAPVRPQFGLKMLQKMGWSPGEGLGKNKEGTIEPLMLDVKMDKKGFHAQEEVTPKKQPIPLAKDLADPLQQNTIITSVGKHPVSALVELCSKNKWSPPDFEMVFDCGPDHKKNFLMKVMVNGQEFKPSVAASTKKMAKANAAAAYLQSLGLYPKDPNNPL